MSGFKPIFMHQFGDVADVLREFKAPNDALKGAKVLLAYYHCGDYDCDSSAFVLFKRGGKLYEVHGAHCSCHGLEGQWEPEETTLEALEQRAEKGSLGSVGGYDGAGYVNESRRVIAHLRRARRG